MQGLPALSGLGVGPAAQPHSWFSWKAARTWPLFQGWQADSLGTAQGLLRADRAGLLSLALCPPQAWVPEVRGLLISKRGLVDFRTEKLTETDSLPGLRPRTPQLPAYPPFLLQPPGVSFRARAPGQSLALAPGQASHPLLTSSSCRPGPSGSPRVILAVPASPPTRLPGSL